MWGNVILAKRLHFPKSSTKLCMVARFLNESIKTKFKMFYFFNLKVELSKKTWWHLPYLTLNKILESWLNLTWNYPLLMKRKTRKKVEVCRLADYELKNVLNQDWYWIKCVNWFSFIKWFLLIKMLLVDAVSLTIGSQT